MGIYAGGIYEGRGGWELVREFEGDFRAERGGKTVIEGS